MAKKLKVYISGPMSGVAELNLPAFRAAEQMLKDAGHSPIVPHDLFEGINLNELKYEDAMRTDLRALLDADAILLLPHHQFSKGSNVEREVAVICGMRIMSINDFVYESKG